MTAPDLAAFLTARLDGELAQTRVTFPESMATWLRNWSAHVHADVDAKRRIIEVHSGRQLTVEPFDWHCLNGCGSWPCPTLRLLALPYADHPDYNESWRPS